MYIRRVLSIINNDSLYVCTGNYNPKPKQPGCKRVR